nr:MAG TPA: chromosome partitioning protein [Caudoviricetes sp.]
MSSMGLLSGLLHTQGSDPAGSGMQVVMIDRKNIIINPDNRKIYRIGDVSRLKEDIKTNGIRQPLEVVELDGGNYKLIGGERRLTACEELAREGDTRFGALPCVILKLKYGDDEKIALITANATARDLTDGERLAQYETLKEILTRRKSLGGLSGKVRDELCRILGLSTGAAARLNAISENCSDDTKRELQAGEITLMGAYRRAQEIIAERMAQQEAAKAPKRDEPVYEKPVVFDCKPESSVTIPKQEQEYPEWVIESAKEVCALDWVKSAPMFTAEALVAAKGGVCGGSLQNGFVDFDSRKVRFWWSGHGEYCFTWAGFVKFCVEKGLAEKPTKTHGLPEKTAESRGKDTLRKLAEKEISQKALWDFDRNLFIFQLDFYKHSLPGGAELYRMEDRQKDEHKRYAIILQDYEFFTSGWETYEEAVESLVRYLNLK